MATKISDQEFNTNWDSMLKMFHGLVAAKADGEEYEALISLAKNTVALTPRQREGIVDRCKNAINGTYGKTKTEENYAHGAQGFSENGKKQ